MPLVGERRKNLDIKQDYTYVLNDVDKCNLKVTLGGCPVFIIHHKDSNSALIMHYGQDMMKTKYDYAKALHDIIIGLGDDDDEDKLLNKNDPQMVKTFCNTYRDKKNELEFFHIVDAKEKDGNSNSMKSFLKEYLNFDIQGIHAIVKQYDTEGRTFRYDIECKLGDIDPITLTQSKNMSVETKPQMPKSMVILLKVGKIKLGSLICLQIQWRKC